MMELQKEDTLEEMWRIKRELGAEHATWDEYMADLLAFEAEERRNGVKFATLRPLEPLFAIS